VSVVTVFLALGSNLGDRRAALADGVAALDAAGVTVDTRSSVYETEPVGVEDQPWFLNQVVRGLTQRAPLGLLTACKEIEKRMGRNCAGVRFGPRTLDIDILLYGDRVIAEEELEIPHPRMRERRFVLIPLVEIAPRLTDPRDGEAYARILERLDEGRKVTKSQARRF